MAINYELLNKGGISLGTNFELLSEKPLDSRLVVPSLTGLQNYIDNAAAYEGMIVYVTSENKHYEVKTIEGVLSYRQFGLTTEELNEIIANATTAAMEFKGATATLPENPAKGDLYKVVGEETDIVINGEQAVHGDSIVYDGENWFLIPSGDDIEDTWRPVDGVNNDATLKFVNGDKTVAAVAADGTIKYNHATVAAPKLLAENEQTRTYITEVETDGYGHITGYKTATENVVDTNTEYTFESQVETSSVYFNVTPNTEGAAEETIYVDAYSKNEADGKFVAKETGKSLVSDTEIARLAEVDNYDDEELRGLISGNTQNLEDLEKYVGTIPTNYTETNVIAYINKKAEETLAAAQGGSSETAASVKQQLDNYKSENDTRVKAAEDAIDAIEADYLKGADKTELANAIAGVKTTADAAATKKYVDETFVVKETGKSLVADTEIARLANVKNYDDTALAGKITNLENNSATKAELQNVDKKFANYVTSEIYNEAVTGFAEAIENVYTKDEADGKFITAVAGIPGPGANPMAMYVCPTKLCRMWAKTGDAINSCSLYILQVDALPEAGIAATLLSNFEYGYQLTTDVTKIYLYNEGGFEEIALDEFNFVSYTELINNPNSEAIRIQTMSDFEPTLHAFNGANWMPVGNDGAGAEAENFLRFAERADVYVKGEVDTAVQGAKDYAKGLVDAIPAQTDYAVTIDEDTTDSTIAKRYIFKQLGQEIGRIDLAKELVVTSGTVKEVTVTDMPYVGAKVGDKYIELVIANQTAPIYIPAKDLVDIYTAAAGAAEVQVAINNTNEISATLVNGGITEAKLHADVKTKLNKTWEEVGVAKGLVDALADGQVKTNTGAIAAINNTSTGILAQAKGYADTKKNEAIAAAKTETENQVKALAGEGNTSTVKKNADDIATLMGLLTWGTF